MNETKKNKALPIVGLVLLLLLCMAGIELVFAGLGAAFPNHAQGGSSSASQSAEGADASQSTGDASSQEAPSFCPFCGEELPSAFQWGQFCPYCGEQVEA